MRTVSCPLFVIFLFSLPWRINSKVTPTFDIKRNNWYITEHQRLTQAAEGPSGLRYDSMDAGKENVVSLSKSGLMQYLTSESGQRISVKTSDIYNWRRKRNIGADGYNLTTSMQTQTEGRTLKQELPSSLMPQAILNTTVFPSPVQPHANMSSHEETTTKGFLDTTESKTPTSTSTGSNDTQQHITNVDGNSTNSTNLPIVQPTLGITVKPVPTTHTHTVTVTTMSDFNKTESMRTTQMDKITTKKTSTSKPKIFTTTPKTTTEDEILLPNNSRKNNPGKAVAAVIGTTFILMFIAIIYIIVRKRKMQKKQLENPEWAGPSPFLDGDVQPNMPNIEESGSVNRRGFRQISKYLPQRLSKHLTFQRDTDEEVFMGDILQGSSTFGNHNQEDVQATNGKPTLVQDLPKTEENENHQGPTSVESVESKIPEVTVNMKESDNQNNDLTTTPSQDTVVQTMPPLVSIDLDSLSEGTAPSQRTDVGNVPPAPPLP